MILQARRARNFLDNKDKLNYFIPLLAQGGEILTELIPEDLSGINSDFSKVFNPAQRFPDLILG